MPSLAQATIDTGDTAWILMATALVLLITLSGLVLFSLGGIADLVTVKAAFRFIDIVAEAEFSLDLSADVAVMQRLIEIATNLA